MRRTVVIVWEAFASAKSSPIASVATILMVAGMCVSVLLTTGRTVGAEQTVLASLDSVGTRAIVLRAEPGAGVNTDVLGRVGTIAGIDWFAAFGAANDVTNARIPDGIKVAARKIYAPEMSIIGIADPSIFLSGSAWASELALSRLGLVDGAGAVGDSVGNYYSVVGMLTAQPWLDFLEPSIFVPTVPEEAEEVTLLVVVADSPELVAAVSSAVQSVLAAEDITKVTLSTSQELAELRLLVEGQLGSFSRGLVLVIFSASSLLLAAILTALVTLRRRDFGRRRALGATRGFILALVLSQSCILSVTGALIGILGALTILSVSRDPLPGLAFTTAIGMLAVLVSLLAALIPATLAARRDPLRELRVP